MYSVTFIQRADRKLLAWHNVKTVGLRKLQVGTECFQ